MRCFVVKGQWSSGTEGFLKAAMFHKDSEWVTTLNRSTWFKARSDALRALDANATYTVAIYNRARIAVPEIVDFFLKTLTVIEIETDEIYWQ